jgi:CRP-like cAMP-binding protein
MKIITRDLTKCEDCAIRNASLFGELETKHLDKARALRSSQIIFPKGSYLYHEGDKPDKAFTINKGWVTLFKNLEDGSRQILNFSLMGDLLCYLPGKNKVLDHSAIAATEVTLCAFPLERFSNTIAELPELSFAISSITGLANQRCHSILTSIASHSAEAKVAYLLLSLYIRESALNNDTKLGIPFPITQEDIAHALGLTAIHVNRVIQGLRKEELIICNNKYLQVNDQEGLAKVAKTNLTELKQLMIAL